MSNSTSAPKRMMTISEKVARQITMTNRDFRPDWLYENLSLEQLEAIAKENNVRPAKGKWRKWKLAENIWIGTGTDRNQTRMPAFVIDLVKYAPLTNTETVR